MTQRLNALRSTRRRSPGVWLALCALLIQSLLPLLDAPLHCAATRAPLVTASATTVTPAEHPPGHTGHECALCQFMANLGSFTPPLPVRVLPPLDGFAVVAPPPTRAGVRPLIVLAAQPRAPPSLI